MGMGCGVRGECVRACRQVWVWEVNRKVSSSVDR